MISLLTPKACFKASILHVLSLLSLLITFLNRVDCEAFDELCVNTQLTRYEFFVFLTLTMIYCAILQTLRKGKDKKANYLVVLFYCLAGYIVIHMEQRENLNSYIDFLYLANYLILIIIILIERTITLHLWLYRTLKKKYLALFSGFVLFIVLFGHLFILYRKRNFERGFNGVMLQTDKTKPALCEMKQYYFPNYDVGIYAIWPLYKLLEVKSCKEKLQK